MPSGVLRAGQPLWTLEVSQTNSASLLCLSSRLWYKIKAWRYFGN
jgi:hypothetical protein